MTINVDDVKMLKSQRLTDEADGGGRATGEPVLDGEMNELFADISRLDRTIGRISLRKVFAGVMTDNADPYLGAHAIVTETPDDPRVSVLLFSTDSQTDERTDARSLIEGYVVPSAVARFELLGDQFAGQRAITGIQRVEARIPEVGEVYQLVNGETSQFVRIQAVEANEEEFIWDYSNGNFIAFTRRRLELTLSSPLTGRYPGGQPWPPGTTASNLAGEPKAQVLSTQVADAARYFGAATAALPAVAGSMGITVDSVYAQLVPSTISERALLSMLAGGLRRDMVDATETPMTVSLQFGRVSGTHSRCFVSTGVSLKTSTLTLDGGVFTSSGDGNFNHQSGSDNYSRIEIDYETGQIDAHRKTSSFSGTATLEYTPAAARMGSVVSGGIDVSLGNRGYVYTLDMSDLPPRPGTLVVSYMVMGKWYELRDAGSGTLEGEGAGSVSYVTGAASVTLSALPDVGTRIICAYVSQLADNIKVWDTASPAVTREIIYRMPEYLDPDPESTEVTIVEKEVPVKVPATVIRDTVYVDRPTVPDPGTDIVVDYTPPPAPKLINTPLTGGSPDAGGMLAFTIPGAPLKPGSVVMDWLAVQRAVVPDGPLPVGSPSAPTGATTSVPRQSTDNGNGGWNGFIGTINYSTGVGAIKVVDTYQWTAYWQIPKANRPGSWETRSKTETLNESFGGTITVSAIGV